MIDIFKLAELFSTAAHGRTMRRTRDDYKATKYLRGLINRFSHPIKYPLQDNSLPPGDPKNIAPAVLSFAREKLELSDFQLSSIHRKVSLAAAENKSYITVQPEFQRGTYPAEENFHFPGTFIRLSWLFQHEEDEFDPEDGGRTLIAVLCRLDEREMT